MKIDLLGLKDASREVIEEILDSAASMKKSFVARSKPAPVNKTVMTLFYENSTRTRVSFEQAAKALSASVSSISTATSSVNKGESLIDTGKTLVATGADIIVIRHPIGGAPHFLAKNIKSAVVNAGDGMNEHPTQALLDMLTMRENLGAIKGLKVAIVGDIRHSRVARSNIYGLTKLGAEVVLCAPRTLLPEGIERFPVKVFNDINRAVEGANVVMALRLQLERQRSGLFPSVAEYAEFFGINERVMRLADPKAILMHPAPLNRGAEITTEVADGDQSVILQQVTNGVAVRMAVLKRVGDSL